VEQAYQLLQQLVAADEDKSAIQDVSWMPRQYLHVFNCASALQTYTERDTFVVSVWSTVSSYGIEITELIVICQAVNTGW